MSHSVNEFLKTVLLESFDFGRFGVVLFFLISGFIIPSSLKPGTTLKKFAITRVFRLYPAFWVACLLIFLTSPYFFNYVVPVYQLLANLTMVPKLFHAPELSGVFWTLFIEILFYFGCAILFQVRQLEKPLTIGIIALALHIVTPLTIFLNHQLDSNYPVRFIPFHLSFLFIGSILRIAINSKEAQARTIALALLTCTFVTVPLITGMFFDVPEAKASEFVLHGATATALSYFLAIATFLAASISKYGFNRLVADLGKISYSLYLLHMLCFAAVAKIITPTTLPTAAVYVVISAVLTYVVSKLSFRFIEEPAVELGRSTTGLRFMKGV